jgi:cytidylate kinase
MPSPIKSLNHSITQSPRRLIITIDGPAGVGKSTVAKLLAKRLGFVYLDTGATYRALAYAALSRGVDPRDARALVRLADSIYIALRQTTAGGLQVILNGHRVTRKIRTERATEAAAIVAQHPAVRAKLVRLQRRLFPASSLVVEGRDTGSVVFPRATHKFFLTATTAVRAGRRQMELRSLQGHAPALAVIARQLKARDRLDRLRKTGPLVRPRGAVLLDTSRLKAHEVVQRILRTLATDSRCVETENCVC